MGNNSLTLPSLTLGSDGACSVGSAGLIGGTGGSNQGGFVAVQVAIPFVIL